MDPLPIFFSFTLPASFAPVTAPVTAQRLREELQDRLQRRGAQVKGHLGGLRSTWVSSKFFEKIKGPDNPTCEVLRRSA